MGACASSTQAKEKEREEPRKSTKPPSTLKIINMESGKVVEYKQPIEASLIASQNPNFFLCNSEFLSIDSCPPKVNEDEVLQLGQIYFLLPLSKANKALKLPDLCGLAIKASTVLGHDGVRILPTDSNSFLR